MLPFRCLVLLATRAHFRVRVTLMDWRSFAQRQAERPSSDVPARAPIDSFPFSLSLSASRLIAVDLLLTVMTGVGRLGAARPTNQGLLSLSLSFDI